MGKVILFDMATVDGFFAGPNGEMEMFCCVTSLTENKRSFAWTKI
jgi:hypothetical protein